MRLIFVVQEYGVRPSGVITVVKQLCQKWRANDYITLLVNKDCQLTQSYFTHSERSGVKVDVLKLGLSLPSDYLYDCVFNKLLNLPLRWFKKFHYFNLSYIIFI